MGKNLVLHNECRQNVHQNQRQNAPHRNLLCSNASDAHTTITPTSDLNNMLFENIVPLPPKPKHKAENSNKRHFRKYPLVMSDSNDINSSIIKEDTENNTVHSIGFCNQTKYVNI